MAHLDDNALTALTGGLLPAPEHAQAQQHLDECASCRRLLVLLAQADPERREEHPRDVQVPEEAPAAIPYVGQTFGGYELRARLGSGAMGTVFAAHEPQLDRLVALKVLRPELTQRSASQARLLLEARALARLSHPNVISVYEVGTVRGRIFIAMELVEGENLKEWLWRPRLWRETVRVMAQAGEGLAAAHAAGLIHRDFKPDNVLVGKDGRARVTDFGLARSNEADVTTTASRGDGLDAELTQTGELLGTPVYMSPEQLRAGPLDARSDQFSFCVTLFEALYGERPFTGDTLARLTAAVSQGQARPPRKARVPAWVNRVVVRGLSPDPKDRFPDMPALLRALSPPLPQHRALRWFALATTVGAATVGAYQWTATRECRGPDAQLGHVWDGPTQAQLRRAFLASGAPFALGTWETVSNQLELFARTWTEARAKACQSRHALLHPRPESVLELACLDVRRDELGALTQALAQPDPRVVARAPTAVRGLTPVQRCERRHFLSEDEPLLRDAALRSRVQALRVRLARARVLYLTGQFGEGERESHAIEDEARAVGHQGLSAEAALTEARFHYERSDWTGARKGYYDAALAAQAAGEDDTALEALTTLITTDINLGQLEAAHRWVDLSDAILRRVGHTQPVIEEAVYRARAALALEEHRLADAQADGERALAVLGGANAHPSTALASALQLLGIVALRRGDNAAALRSFEQILRIDEQLLGPLHPTLAKDHNSYGVALKHAGRFAQAQAELQASLRIAEVSFGPKSPKLIVALNNLALILNRRREFAKAEELYAREEAICVATGSGPRDLADLSVNRAGNESDGGRPEAARAHLARARELYARIYGRGSDHEATVLSALAAVERTDHHPDRALELYRASTAVLKRLPEPDDRGIARNEVNEAQLELELGRTRAALALLKHADAWAPPEPDDRAEVDFTWARALWAAGKDRPRALERAHEALGLLDDQLDPGGVRRKEISTWLTRRGLKGPPQSP